MLFMSSEKIIEKTFSFALIQSWLSPDAVLNDSESGKNINRNQDQILHKLMLQKTI